MHIETLGQGNDKLRAFGSNIYLDGYLRLDAWLALFGLVLCFGALIWFFLSPWLFHLQVSILLLSLLLLVIGGIGVLQSPPAWMWIGLIVFVFGLMDFTIRRGGVEAGGFDIQSVFKGLVWILILIFGLVHGARHVFRDNLLSSLFLYSVFAFGSAFYSRAMFLGVGSGVALLAIAMYASVISAWPEQRVRRMWQGLFITVFILAAASLFLYFVFPDWARDWRASGAGRLKGVTGSGNSLGPIMSAGVIVGTYLLTTMKSKLETFAVLGAVIVILVALVLSQSRASMIGLAMAFLLVAAFRNFFMMLVTAAIAGVLVWTTLQPDIWKESLDLAASVLSRSGRIGEITTFTGRSQIWAAIIPEWLNSPWIGYGLGSPRIIISEAYTGPWGQKFESAHNWLLESLISFGIAGTLLLVIFLGRLGWRLWHFQPPAPRGSDRGIDWQLVITMRRLFIFCLVSGVMEKAFAGMPSPTTILLACMAGSCAVLSKNGAMVPSDLHSGGSHRT